MTTQRPIRHWLPHSQPRKNIGIKYMTPEQRQAYSRERYQSAKERRKALGLTAAGQVPKPSISRRVGDLKQCQDCDRWLPLARFYLAPKTKELHGRCRICARAYTKGWRLNAETAAWFEEQLEGAVCWICEAPNHLVIDHDHKTGKARGILCTHCNSLIGHFKESSERMQRPADYLKHHGQ
jgi:hypothetical protein